MFTSTAPPGPPGYPLMMATLLVNERLAWTLAAAAAFGLLATLLGLLLPASRFISLGAAAAKS